MKQRCSSRPLFPERLRFDSRLLPAAGPSPMLRVSCEFLNFFNPFQAVRFWRRKTWSVSCFPSLFPKAKEPKSCRAAERKNIGYVYLDACLSFFSPKLQPSAFFPGFSSLPGEQMKPTPMLVCCNTHLRARRQNPFFSASSRRRGSTGSAHDRSGMTQPAEHAAIMQASNFQAWIRLKSEDR